MADLQVATWNVLHGHAPGPRHHDPAAVDVSLFAEAVRALDADVLALQEVDRGQPRTMSVDLTTVAAEAMGATHWRFAAAMVGEPGSWVAAADRVAGGRADAVDEPAYGVALLSRRPVRRWGGVALPALPVPVPWRWPGQLRPTWVRDEARVALLAEVETPLGVVCCVATHVSFLPGWNDRQLRWLRARLPHGPAMLLGDLNLGVRRAVAATGWSPCAAGPTFPGDVPRRQIDHVLVRDLPGPDSTRVVGLTLSDHRALVASWTELSAGAR